MLYRYGFGVDLDRYLATHRPAWERLADLTGRGRRRMKSLDEDEIAEMVQLYQRTSSHLSYVRTYYRDPALIAYLTRLVSSSGSVIYGTRPRTLRTFARFVMETFPAAIWRARRFIAVSGVLLLLPALLAGIWIANSPDALDAAMPEAAREAYINEDFEEYYESERASQFASSVFTNNVQVSIIAFAGGVFFCIPTVVVMVTNGIAIGFAGGTFAAVGESAKFWGLISPHGLLELSAVIIAGGAGLQLGWSLIAPGDRTRGRALVEEGRRAVVILLGLVPAFAVAGLIEGFVTGQPWPTALRVGIGTVVWLAFVGHLVVRGRAASSRGLTGSLGEDEASGWARAS